MAPLGGRQRVVEACWDLLQGLVDSLHCVAFSIGCENIYNILHNNVESKAADEFAGKETVGSDRDPANRPHNEGQIEWGYSANMSLLDWV
eukprot:CAMPEP_0185280600 /NCGR_PEP_ID=MMETSP1359-20130426/66227_1 /TAXON_ID=552665 /ORGANISM="Bigelowiella longifila, Strain CCMP242" /LENGTH=89 /DNA_ID=CAMNT_0027875889 /DNA_START=539 /DNA_END=808 /DNA_ORIENTATION=+